MKTISIFRASALKVKLPRVPRNIIDESGRLQSIASFTNDELSQIGTAWTHELQQRAAVMRGAPRAKG